MNTRSLSLFKSIGTIMVLVAYTLFFLVFLFSCAPNGSPQERSFKVVATIYPIYDMAKQVGGSRVEVVCLMDAGESPHTFEFTPDRVKRLQGADIALKVGLGLDDWLEGTIRSLDQDIEVHDIHRGIDLMGEECSHAHESDDHNNNAHGSHDHNHHVNPHIWLSLENAKAIVGNIQSIFSEKFPEHDSYFIENKNRYIQEIDKLDTEFRKEAEGFGKKEFIAHHDAWVYLARDLGLKQVMSVEPFPGKEPTPAYIIQLQKTIDNYEIDTILIEPQLSADVVNFLTQDMDLEVRVLDPLGGTEGTETYLDMMSYNFGQLKDALR